MPFIQKSGIAETSTTTGTGTYTLAGAMTGFLPFSGIGVSNTCPYVATDGTGREWGIGTVGSGTLARTTILGSTNGGSAVNWGAGTKTILCAPLAESLFMGQVLVGSFTRDLSTASGTQALTGFNFKPRFAIFVAANAAGGSSAMSIGFASSAGTNLDISDRNATSAGTYAQSTSCITAVVSGGSQVATVTTWDSSGLTLTWTKNASPTGTLTINYLAFA